MNLNGQQIEDLARKAKETARHLHTNMTDMSFTLLESGRVIGVTNLWNDREIAGTHEDEAGPATFFITNVLNECELSVRLA